MRKTNRFVLRVFIKINIVIPPCITQNESVHFAGVYLRSIFSLNHNGCRQNTNILIIINSCKRPSGAPHIHPTIPQFHIPAFPSILLVYFVINYIFL
jgi:hypothetical protein